jgi:hypothetical protein
MQFEGHPLNRIEDWVIRLRMRPADIVLSRSLVDVHLSHSHLCLTGLLLPLLSVELQ